VFKSMGQARLSSSKSAETLMSDDVVFMVPGKEPLRKADDPLRVRADHPPQSPERSPRPPPCSLSSTWRPSREWPVHRSSLKPSDPTGIRIDRRLGRNWVHTNKPDSASDHPGAWRSCIVQTVRNRVPRAAAGRPPSPEFWGERIKSHTMGHHYVPQKHLERFEIDG
jgi:hypothetical protein